MMGSRRSPTCFAFDFVEVEYLFLESSQTVSSGALLNQAGSISGSTPIRRILSRRKVSKSPPSRCTCTSSEVMAVKALLISTAKAVAKQGVAAFFVNGFALDVHHVVVFEQAFADAEVVFLHFFLCAFDGFGHHRVLDHVAFFVAHFVHQAGDAVALEQAHEVVFERHVELREPGSPWRPARPRNWRSTRRLSWRSVPMMAKPPASFTPGPSLMSVPRPAMLVAMVTLPAWPASATISASRWCCLAFSTL
jgi:hypothetical protein